MASQTRPRVAIAAMYGSPGPCYGLPTLTGFQEHDPRSSHQKMPAPSLGRRHAQNTQDCSPGPAYALEANMNRHGKSGEPHYSIYSRPRDMTQFRTPGPGRYSSEQSALTSDKAKAPSHSMAKRFRMRQQDCTPGANNYTLPNVTGGKTCQSHIKQYPSYCMPGRSMVGSFTQDLAKTPGPGTYKTTDPSVNNNKAPSHSMTSRNMLPGDSTRKPGPGAHSPEHVYMTKQQAPQFTFGIRHSPYIAPLIVDPLCD